MEKAILKTLIYSDIFEYPLTLYEIHKWLIGKKINLRQLEKVLKLSKKVRNKKGYFFLRGKDSLVGKRLRRQKQSLLYIRKVTLIAYLFKIIPWLKLVGISGGLSMENADKRGDIDLFIITSKNRLWLSRLLILGLLSFLGQRRKVTDSLKAASGKICCNILVDTDHLNQQRHDIYTSHEVLQMKVLWQRDEIYSKYLSDNYWVFKFLPNWVASLGVLPPQYPVVRPRLASIAAVMRREPSSASPLALLEILSKRIQLKIMQKPKGMERLEEGALYFHPNDVRDRVLKKYRKRTSKF